MHELVRRKLILKKKKNSLIYLDGNLGKALWQKQGNQVIILQKKC